MSKPSSVINGGRGLRFATYLCPSLPVEYFELVVHEVERQLAVPTTLLYESRWQGPPADRPDPFGADAVDVAFVNSVSYLQLVDSKNANVELLPVTSVHKHGKGEGKPSCFADVVVHIDLVDKVKEFLDLRGSKWAYNSANSLGGYLITLNTLKELGENPSFFGNLLPSGSHINSIQMVLQKQVDAAAVDANCLAIYLDRHPEARQELFCLTSWGPLPPYPIVVNNRVPAELKTQLTNSLLNMAKDPSIKKRLSEFHVLGFAPNDSFIYDQERDLIKNLKGLKLETVYY